LLRDIINEHIEIYAPGEDSIRASIPTLKEIIAITSKQRDEWDDSPDGINWKRLKRTTATQRKHRQLIVVSKDDTQAITDTSNIKDFNHLQNIRDGMVN